MPRIRKPHSEETRRKMSMALKGRIAWNKGLKGFNKGVLLGRKRPDMTGEKSHWWIKDRTKLIKRNQRNDSAYYDWRRQVWVRDNEKCKIADKNCNGKIEAHHILGWRSHPELRYEINNGITLCHAHHPRGRAKEQLLVPTFQELISQMN